MRTSIPVAIACAISALMPLASGAAAPTTSTDAAPVQATWRLQEIRYSYVGFTTAYACDAAETKLKSMLLAVGAHPDTKVQAQGCDFSRPSRNFFITITAATPVLVGQDAAQPGDKSRQELLKRLGAASQLLGQTFPAEWKTLNLSRERRLVLNPGDCELMDGFARQVLPKLSVKVVENRVDCVPRQLSIQTPELTVSALMPVKSPDVNADARKTTAEKGAAEAAQ